MIEAAALSSALIIYLIYAKVLQGQPSLSALIAQKAELYELELPLVKAIIKIESNFNPLARNPSDPSYGLMQITPEVAFDYHLISSSDIPPSLSDIAKMMYPPNNLDIGCKHLKYLLDHHNINAAIQMYNVGEHGYLKGIRNEDYLRKVIDAYSSYD